MSEPVMVTHPFLLMKRNLDDITEKEFLEKYQPIDYQNWCLIIFCTKCYFMIAALFASAIITVVIDLIRIIGRFKASGDTMIVVYWICCIIIFFVLLYICLYDPKYKERKQFISEIGLSRKQANNLYCFLKEESYYVKAIYKICNLNPEARESQINMIKEWYKFDDESVVNFIDNGFKMSDYQLYEGHFVLKEISQKKKFVDRMFQLAFVMDGIHNDEWNLLMNIMKQLNFNDNYIGYFQKRYGPLRTEFEADEQGEKQSTENIPVSQLKAYFAILGLEEGASDQEIKRAYHNLALQHHPDLPKNADRVEECETMMARINEAYEKIRN